MGEIAELAYEGFTCYVCGVTLDPETVNGNPQKCEEGCSSNFFNERVFWAHYGRWKEGR